MQETQNYKLKKIDKETDKILDSIDYLNENFDDIDEELSKKIDETGNTSNTTVTFTESEEKTDIESGDKLSVLFGKIKKNFKSIDDSLGDVETLLETITTGSGV